MELAYAKIEPRDNFYVAEVNGVSCLFDNWIDAVLWADSLFSKKGGEKDATICTETHR